MAIPKIIALTNISIWQKKVVNGDLSAVYMNFYYSTIGDKQDKFVSCPPFYLFRLLKTITPHELAE